MAIQRKKQPTCIERILSECITPWNGALYTRAEVVRELTIKKFSPRAIDFWAFHENALTDEQITALYEQGQLINTVANQFPAWFEQVRWEI